MPRYAKRMRTTEAVDADLLAAATQIRRGATSLAARARVERGGVLSLNQTAVLGQLRKGGAMTPGEVAERLRMRPQSLTRTFAAADERGLIHRTPDPGDGRQSLLSITAAGRRVLGEEMRPRDVWLAATIARELTIAEREVLVVAARLMERLSEVDVTPAQVEP